MAKDRQLGVGEATFYAWKKKYAHLGVSELRRLENAGDHWLLATRGAWRVLWALATTPGFAPPKTDHVSH